MRAAAYRRTDQRTIGRQDGRARAKIARYLHDTLLQSTQGLILRFQAAANGVPDDDPIRQVLETALVRADSVVAEARDRVQDLRLTGSSMKDLPHSLAVVGEELARDCPIDFVATVQGKRHPLNPLARNEIYRIAREALLNAFRHSNARSIELQIIFARDEFSVRVRDDGDGLDVDGLNAGSRPGHWGLKGMRERSEQLGAKLEIWSRPGAGTEVQLLVPAALAYQRAERRYRWIRGRRFASE